MAGDLLSKKLQGIRRIARAHGVVRVRVFGSYGSRWREPRDLDLLVDLQPKRDLLDLIEFKLDLEDLVGCRVDVVTERGLSPYLRRRILREARPL